jgi:hypothetical protein
MRSEGKEKLLTYLQIALLLCTWTVGFSWYSLWNGLCYDTPEVHGYQRRKSHTARESRFGCVPDTK